VLIFIKFGQSDDFHNLDSGKISFRAVAWIKFFRSIKIDRAKEVIIFESNVMDPSPEAGLADH
jgi:hypothetical protein